MAHEVYWLKKGQVLYATYQGYQTVETMTACMDDMAAHFDSVEHPVMVLINWMEVTETAPGALMKTRGHRVFSHPMAARGVLVGFPKQTAFENEVTAVSTRGDKNTIYFNNMSEAKSYLKNMLEVDYWPEANTSK